MTRNDWLCPMCGDVMVRLAGSKYMVCLCGNGKLHPCRRLQNLLEAYKINSRDFWIRGYPHDVYQYVPHGHKTALGKAPAEGQVVASAAFRGGRAVRLFRRKGSLKTLRERLTEHHFQELGREAEK